MCKVQAAYNRGEGSAPWLAFNFVHRLSDGAHCACRIAPGRSLGEGQTSKPEVGDGGVGGEVPCGVGSLARGVARLGSWGRLG